MIPHRNTRELGQAVERQAERHLEQQGLMLVARNYRCKAGEIDLIMRDGAVTVFVEVRFRQSARFGDSAATVTWQKQQRLIRAAQYYLLAHKASDSPCRFDVIAAQSGNDKRLQLDWIRNAFGIQ